MRSKIYKDIDNKNVENIFLKSNHLNHNCYLLFQFPTPDVPETECDRIWREGKIETKRGYEFRGLEMIVTILFEFLGSGSAYLWEHRQSRGWSGCSDAGKWEKKSDGRCKNNARHIGTFESDCRKAEISQVMVCGDRVGWREEARRVIIYTTDQVQWWWSPTSSSSYNWPVGPSSDAQVLFQIK